MNEPPTTNKYYLTYGIFYLLGILTFIPNYFVITASAYWIFKFRHDPSHPPHPPDPYDPPFGPPPHERNMFQASFFSTYFIITQLSLIISIVLTSTCSQKLPPPEKRITAALFCMLGFYIVNLIFVNLVTDNFQVVFFLLVMMIACFLGISCAVIIVSLFEMVNNFPTEYYLAILTGQALCGVTSALIQIITICVSDGKPTTAGVIFFGIGTAIVCLTLSIYSYSKRNSQYFIYHVDNIYNLHYTVSGPNNTMKTRKNYFIKIWEKVKIPVKRIKIHIISLIIVFGTTATIYPGIMSLVASEHSNGRSDNKWNELYFVPVVTFLVANLCDLCGRLMATVIKKPTNQWIVLIVTIIRIGLVPLILFCNAQPRIHTPVLFNDVTYSIFTILFLFSNGYLINLCVITVINRAQNKEEESLITIMTVLSGVLSTAVCSFLSLIMVHVM